MHKKPLTIIGSLIVLAAVAGAIYWTRDTSPKMPDGIQVSDLVSVSVDSGSGTPDTEKLLMPASSTAFDVIRRFAEVRGLDFDYKAYPGMGSLVQKIGDTENGTGGAYWQYWVNGVYAEKAADLAIVQPGDLVEWKFKK